MADPNAALATQLRNIEAKTGKSLDQLRQLLAGSGLAKHGEKRSFLMTTLGLGHGDANTVVHLAAQPPDGAGAGAADDDPLAAIYTGAKAHLRPLHEAVIAAIDGLGPYETAPKKAYVSLRRNKQFAMLGPATKEQVELGLNIKDLPPHPRLKALAPGGMCQYTVRLSGTGEIDADLLGWLRAAYAAAG
jgi:hypothetical protein